MKYESSMTNSLNTSANQDGLNVQVRGKIKRDMKKSTFWQADQLSDSSNESVSDIGRSCISRSDLDQAILDDKQSQTNREESSFM